MGVLGRKTDAGRLEERLRPSSNISITPPSRIETWTCVMASCRTFNLQPAPGRALLVVLVGRCVPPCAPLLDVNAQVAQAVAHSSTDACEVWPLAIASPQL